MGGFGSEIVQVGIPAAQGFVTGGPVGAGVGAAQGALGLIGGEGEGQPAPPQTAPATAPDPSEILAVLIQQLQQSGGDPRMVQQILAQLSGQPGG